MTISSTTLICGLVFTLSINGMARQISAADERIQVHGAKYVSRTESGLSVARIREDVLNKKPKALGLNPKKARTTTGVILAFQTDSQKMGMMFRALPGENRGSEFGVFENGKLIQEFRFSNEEESLQLDIQSKTTGSSLFEVTLPSWANVELKTLDIDDTAKLEKIPNDNKKVYVALGDSISHGVGQGSATHKTWPFLLSRKLDAELFNLAVGGGKVSVPVVQMLKDWERIDLITILIGYNDLHFDGKTPEEYEKAYHELLDAIRTNHPETEIYCITPLFTKNPIAEKTGHSIQQFREILSKLVEQRMASDKKLHLIDGDKITSEKNLRTEKPSDPVHLGIEGARQFSAELSGFIRM
jgi:lysophospholipase L1-like esterase